ncbi:MAG TPA: hypothetical protein VFK24_10095 [Gammaproteobacteria bacterium]|nr:hypothetical protein [Gammaproteobacteria bacterium]
MGKILMATAGALAVAGMLQGCASVPGSYYDSRYQPPPGYILVPAPEGYSGYYGPFYNPYNWNPDFSAYYLNRGNPFYFPFYAPFIYGSFHRHPRPQPEQPPSPHVKPAPKGGEMPQPRFIPPGESYSDYWRRRLHKPGSGWVPPQLPQPKPRAMPYDPPSVIPHDLPSAVPSPAPVQPPPKPRRNDKRLRDVHQVPPR